MSCLLALPLLERLYACLIMLERLVFLVCVWMMQVYGALVILVMTGCMFSVGAWLCGLRCSVLQGCRLGFMRVMQVMVIFDKVQVFDIG